MSRLEKPVIFELEGVFVNGKDLILNEFKKYFREKFPQISLTSIEDSPYLDLLDLFERVNFSESHVKNYPKLEMKNSLSRESKNAEIIKHIEKINRKICLNLKSLEIRNDNVQKFKAITSRVALYSRYDSIVTLEIIKILNIDKKFDVILTRNDLSESNNAKKLFEHFGIFFDCKIQDMTYTPGTVFFKNEILSLSLTTQRL